jgi:ring-1,2-phenylacetyl-CoA epoxidase subunit PaaC
VTASTSPDDGQSLVDYLLRLGDTTLVLSHRLSEWVGAAPTLEEEIALANVALDLLGQAQPLLARAGEVEGLGRDADALAYLRDAWDYRNLLLVEQPNGDFAHTMLRQFLFDSYAVELWSRLATSTDATLAGIAGKAVKESAYHVGHSGEWVIRLGDGTTESARRTRDAVADLWEFTGELFATDAVDEAIAASGVAPLASELEPAWRDRVDAVFADAGLEVPTRQWMQSGGKKGRHTEHLGHVLAEMQFLPRAYPGSTW